MLIGARAADMHAPRFSAPRLRALRRLSWTDRATFAAAWALLGLARLSILLTPFSVVRRHLGENSPQPLVTCPIDDAALARARRIGAALEIAARHTPWRSDCYPQALAARALLVRAGIGHAVQFGLRRDGADSLRAHAWVTAGDVVVTGGDIGDYVVVRSFTWTPHPSRTKAFR